MTTEIEIDGRTWTVDIEPIGAADRAGGQFRVTMRPADPLDDRARDALVVEARRTDLGVSLTYADTARVVDAAVTARPGGEYLVQLPHVDVTSTVDGRRARTSGGAAGGDGEHRVTAPMPGRVLRVLVAPGDEVAARQGLVVVEAMKMENELTSPRAGRVREVHVTEGASVEAGRLLIVIEARGGAGGPHGLR